MSRSFDELVSEAAAAPIDGWDFSWLDGRATEERPSWGYQRLLSQRLATVSAALDIHTGGGEVLAGAKPFPPTMVAIETWPPNAALATKLLHPLGVVVVAVPDEPPLPFADQAFDLVTFRQPLSVWVDGDGSGAPAGRPLLRAAHRTCHDVRAGRVFHRTATGEMGRVSPG